MTADTQVITKSRLSVFNACQRLHRIEYIQGYRPVEPHQLAEWGNMFHAGADSWFDVYRVAADEIPLPGIALAAALTGIRDYAAAHPAIDESSLAKAEIMMTAYDARWADSMREYEVLGIEVEFIAMIPGRRKLRIAGKIDKLLRRRADGSIWYMDHKTTGADLSAGSTYWTKLRLDPQVSIYFGGCRALGYEPAGCLYDVIDRPAQKLFKATPEDKRKYTKGGQLYANQRATDETIEEFRERLGSMIAEAPDAYFARAEIVRLETELEESAKDVEETALQIRAAAASDHAPRNPDHCFLYGRACSYFDVCSGVASLDDESKFRRIESPHEELTLKSA